MATITRYLSKSADAEGACEVSLRVSISRERRYRLGTGLRVRPDRFKDGRVRIPRASTPEAARLSEIEAELSRMEGSIRSLLARNPQASKDELARAARPDLRAQGKTPFFALLDEYAKRNGTSANRRMAYAVMARALKRYELYQALDRKNFRLDAAVLDKDEMRRFLRFLSDEWRLAQQRPGFYESLSKEAWDKRRGPCPKRRSPNTVYELASRMRAFLNWCVEEGEIASNPMEGIRFEPEVYGEPFYLTIGERDALAALDLSKSPALERQRDVFVFQCHVGCRYGDLRTLSPDNVSEGWLEYVPQKTLRSTGAKVRVPLTAAARAIVKKYEGFVGKALKTGGARLLPTLSPRRYNDAIRAVCKLAGLDRMVSVVNPADGTSERRPIWAVATSHMARRTFVGNLYRKVKDPKIVGSMSGHADGSKAFARYRVIDDDIKRELIEYLE